MFEPRVLLNDRDVPAVEFPKLSVGFLNDFLATGGEGYDAGKRASSSRPLDIVDLDALIDYLRSLPSPFTAPREVRIAPVTR